MIDFTKPVQTKTGRPVRIISMEGPNKLYPVVGYIQGAAPMLVTWGLDGHVEMGRSADIDLVQSPINFNLPVQTRDGRSVRIVCTDGPDPYPVIGIIEGQRSPTNWTLEGYLWVNKSQSIDDLVQVPGPHPERIDGFFYVNVYTVDGQPKVGSPWDTKELAENTGDAHNRFAILRVNFSVTKGQSDD